MDGLLQNLCLATGLRESVAHRIILTAPLRYKDFPIPKKSGGERIISQPSREVKLLQRAFVHLVLEKLPVHKSATAYVKGSSTLGNALPHAGNGPVLKLDFKDFFPSIKNEDWKIFCRANSVFCNDVDIDLSSLLLFRKMRGERISRLAIGAPSSPMLSNVLMYEFDHLISEVVAKDRVVYTRYADDLTFSAPRTGFLVNVREAVQATLKQIRTPKLIINNDKTTYVTTRYGRYVTGLVLANDGSVGIGKQKKRIIHASVHNALLGKLDAKEMRSLAGNLAYINSVDPDFLNVLVRRYGSDIVREIQRTVIIKSVRAPVLSDDGQR